MHSYFVVMHQSGVTFHYFKKELNENIFETSLENGDLLEVTNEGFCIDSYGWFILTILNGQTKMYIWFNDLEECIQQRLIWNVADVELTKSAWYNQINQALEENNQEWFKFVSRKLLSLQSVTI